MIKEVYMKVEFNVKWSAKWKNSWIDWYSNRSIKVPRKARYWMTYEVVQPNIENEENAWLVEDKYSSPLYIKKNRELYKL